VVRLAEQPERSRPFGGDTPKLRTTAQIFWAEPTDPDMIATINFSVPTAGSYVIWGMVEPHHASKDGLWVRVNGGSWIRWDGIISPANTYAWHWNTVHDSDNGGATVSFTLAAGAHTIEIAPYERETLVDRLYITSANDTPQYAHVAATAPGVTVEAETATLTATTDWLIRPAYTFENASGGLIMQALPDSGTENDTTYVTDAPRLDYQVNFVQAGQYTIRFKGQPLLDGNSSTSDTVHVGLNGVATASSEKMKSFNANFWFSNRKLDAARATITIPSAGVHTINVWMREDGFKADKLVLVPGSSENSLLPFGPPESPRVAGQGGGGSGALPEPEHDAAGNIVVMPDPNDWTKVYAAEYDAWNRLTQVSYATKQPGGTVTVGLPLAELRYDGLGRRIVYRATNTAGAQGGVGALDYEYHDYYDGQRMAETRNGSDLVARQQVWGLDYIDELIEISHNPDPADATEQDCEDAYYALHDAQYCVLGLVAPEVDGNDNLTGQVLVERYEYTPYGERQVFTATGPGDDTLTQPVDHSQVTLAGATLNPFGHQGLHHDEATGLVYNRARMLHPGLGRFVQRDPLGYVDGMSVYGYYAGMWGGVDPSGLAMEGAGESGLNAFCRDLQKRIEAVKQSIANLRRELADRETELRQNLGPHQPDGTRGAPLPEHRSPGDSPRDSRDGHRKVIGEMRRDLKNRHDELRRLDQMFDQCKPPCKTKEKSPVDITKPVAVVGVTVVGIVVVKKLVGGILVAIPEPASSAVGAALILSP